MSFSKHCTAPEGEKRPCSQSRKVATGVLIRSANACCDKPVSWRAVRSRICSGVCTRPTPDCISAKLCLSSSKGMPASASMACAIFSMSTLHRLLNIAGPNIGLIGFLIKRYQYNGALFGQVEINNADTAAFAFNPYRPVDFTYAFDNWDHIARQRIAGNPVKKRQTLILGPDFLGLFLECGRFSAVLLMAQ